MVKSQQEVRSLLGHIKITAAKNNLTSFSACTFAYLEPHDLIKLLQLSRDFRINLLSQNDQVYI